MNSLKPTTLEESIYATVAYFDLFDYPLTKQELWTFLLYPPSAQGAVRIEDVIDISVSMPELEWMKGFVFIKGRGAIIQLRIDRYLIAERKIKKALRFSRVCALVPGVAMIALCNTLAFSHSRDSSDIDFFIIAKKGYLWFVRAASIVLSMAFGKRLSELHMRDALCLSFFVSDDALDLSIIALPLKGDVEDIYLAAWVSRCIPLYNEAGRYEQFWNANQWAAFIFPNRLPYMTNHMRRIRHSPVTKAIKNGIQSLFGLFRPIIESACEMIQRKKFPRDIQCAMQTNDSGVVVQESILKFHLTDKRSEFRDALLERLHLFRQKRYGTDR